MAVQVLGDRIGIIAVALDRAEARRRPGPPSRRRRRRSAGGAGPELVEGIAALLRWVLEPVGIAVPQSATTDSRGGTLRRSPRRTPPATRALLEQARQADHPGS